MDHKLRTIQGEPSWILRSDRVELAVTRKGGHLAPVTFDRQSRRIQPFHVSPFASEGKWTHELPVIQVLRGDFFCMPFGGNQKPWRGEKHSLHSEPPSKTWTFVSSDSSDGLHTLNLQLRLKIRKGLLTKKIMLRDGEDVVYQEHLVSGMKGPNCPGHHPNLEFRSPGRIAASPFLWGSTYPYLMETGEKNQSYCALKPGHEFRKLGKVPLVYGGESDLSIYPARRGFVDCIQLVADPKLPVAWNTVTFPEEGWLYFSLRDPKVLRQTLMWFSNGGRYGPPWNGRHINVLGIEDHTCYFGEGLAVSAAPNPWTRRGIQTVIHFNPKKPTAIRYIMGVAKIPKGFQDVRKVRFEKDGVIFQGNKGESHARVDWKFVKA